MSWTRRDALHVLLAVPAGLLAGLGLRGSSARADVIIPSRWDVDIRSTPEAWRYRVRLDGREIPFAVAASAGPNGTVLVHALESATAPARGKIKVHKGPCRCPPELDRNRWDPPKTAVGIAKLYCLPLEILRGRVEIMKTGPFQRHRVEAYT